MIKKLTTIFIIGFAVAALTACNKQVQIENTLTSGQGRWKIDELSIAILFDTVTTTSLYDDVGEMIFYESATGVWIQYDTTLLVKVARYFEWENTESELTFQFDDVPPTTPETIFEIVTNSADSVRLRKIDNYDSLGLPTVRTTEMLLQKSDELTHI